MILHTRHTNAARAATRWAAQYRDTRRETTEALLALGDAPTPEAVNKIIGNESWTRCTCNECGRDVEAVVQLGEELDCESHTVWICLDCIRLAVAAFEAA